MVKQVLSLHLDHCLLFMEIQVSMVMCIGVPSIRGNAEISPERQSELEFGFDAGF
jgi:hypothetical protein